MSTGDVCVGVRMRACECVRACVFATVCVCSPVCALVCPYMHVCTQERFCVMCAFDFWFCSTGTAALMLLSVGRQSNHQ